MMDQDILRDAAETAVAGVPIWFSLTHDPCRFKSWEAREKSRLEVKNQHPEMEWKETGVMLARVVMSVHCVLKTYSTPLNHSIPSYPHPYPYPRLHKHRT